jgi:hypothetical protein
MYSETFLIPKYEQYAFVRFLSTFIMISPFLKKGRDEDIPALKQLYSMPLGGKEFGCSR